MEVVRNLNLVAFVFMAIALFAMIVELRWRKDLYKPERKTAEIIFVICSSVSIGIYILSSVIAFIQVFQPS